MVTRGGGEQFYQMGPTKRNEKPPQLPPRDMDIYGHSLPTVRRYFDLHLIGLCTRLARNYICFVFVVTGDYNLFLVGKQIFNFFFIQPDYDDAESRSKSFFRSISKDTERKKYGKKKRVFIFKI